MKKNIFKKASVANKGQNCRTAVETSAKHAIKRKLGKTRAASQSCAERYLRCISGYEKGVCATGVVIVVHCSCYIKGHELQGGDVPGQAAVAVV